MSDCLEHRGPDGQGQLVIGPAGLAHRRLAVIDLNERSLQPMQTTDKRYAVVFNGEIYNFRELRLDLESRGHHFRTESDTEVLLHGYREWGPNILERLTGMFAFAVWDNTNRTLFAARDRFGQKPLYFYYDNDVFVFGSEIKSILEWPSVTPEIDLSVTHDYLTFGYCTGGHSAFKNIHRLEPASAILLSNGRVGLPYRYWELPPPTDATGGNTKQLANELVERLDQAIEPRMISDVPVGAFLSGGVDSAAIVARMSTMAPGQIKTFSVGFPTEGYDETAHALAVANRYETDHHSFMMDADILEYLPKLIWHYGEPYSDSSSLVMYALAKEVRNHVTVAMTGDGGDETLIGYSRYQRFLQDVARIETNGHAAVYPNRRIGPYGDEPKLRDVYAYYIAKFQDEHKLRGYGPALAEFLFTSSNDRLGILLDNATGNNAVDLVARTDVETYLPNDLLVKVDVATMANGLEARSPFLDHEFAGWATTLPQSARIFQRRGSLQMKALLKRAMEPHLPESVIYRRKQGFSVPIKHWMRHEIKDLLIDSLTSRRFRERGFFSIKFIDWMLDQHLTERQDHGTRLWGLLCLELWCQTFLDAGLPQPIDVTASSGSGRRPTA